MLIRRAFDIGSGSIKCQVAEVDTAAMRLGKVLYARTQPVLSLNPEGEIGPAAQAAGLAAIESMLRESQPFSPVASAGIATEAFRRAQNGAAVVQHFAAAANLPISIIPPAQEGRLGYLSARALRPTPDAEQRLVAWDAGAGSFQFSNGVASHSDRHGSGTVHAVAAQIQAKSPGLSQRALLGQLLDFLHLRLLPRPAWLGAMEAPEVVGVGSAQSIFSQCRVLLCGRDSFTQTDVEKTLDEVVGLDPEELHSLEQQRGAPLGYSASRANIPYVLPKLALLLGVMRKFRLDSLEFRQTHGSCAGLLVDPTVWGESPSQQQPSEVPSFRPSGRPITTRENIPSTLDLPDAEQRRELLLTFNWHLQKTCNYKCSFCYAHFADPSTLNLDQAAGLKLLDAMKDWGVFKVNFAGGEPLLNPHLGAYLRHAHSIGLKTSLITNASKMTMNWLREHAPYINQVGISCDSIHESVNKSLGRGGGAHVAITERAFSRLHEINQSMSLDIKLKLNTVVTRLNHMEDWTEFIRRNKVQRWKVFKVLKIEGENDRNFDQLEISDAEFAEFKARHAALAEMVPEDNDDMTSSYIMVTPDGKFFQNTEGKYSTSQPILQVGVQAALEEVGFDWQKFRRRGGAYSL